MMLSVCICIHVLHVCSCGEKGLINVLIQVKWLFRGHRQQTSMLLIVPLLNGLYRSGHHKQRAPLYGRVIVLYGAVLNLWSEMHVMGLEEPVPSSSKGHL